jgi:hypothetical protein
MVNETKKGSALQRRQQTVVGSVQEMKLQSILCRFYKDEKFGGFTAENYRANTMIAPWSYSCLREDDFQQAPPHILDMTKPKSKWNRKDHVAWMEMRGIEFESDLTAKEVKHKVKLIRAEYGVNGPPILDQDSTKSTRIEAWEMRDLVWRLFNMFRSLFCLDLAGTKAKNRSTASVMHFLFLMEDLDSRLYPKRKQPIWTTKFNMLGLLRASESFERFNHVRNLYEGGILGEGMVKQLRPLVSKKVHGKWATNLLVAYYRRSTLDTLIVAVEKCRSDHEQKVVCATREVMDVTKFKRFATMADVRAKLVGGKPISVVLFGSEVDWKAGVIVVAKNHWLFYQIFFHQENAYQDRYGFTYLKVTAENQQPQCLVGEVMEKSVSVGTQDFPFWDYGLLLPEFVGDGNLNHTYAMVRSTWQYLGKERNWCEFNY